MGPPSAVPDERTQLELFQALPGGMALIPYLRTLVYGVPLWGMLR